MLPVAKEGYAKIGLLMGRHDEFAIFRRFRALNMQNLLYMQAEIAFLEEQLLGLVHRDAGDADRVLYTRDWWSLSQSDDEEEREQWGKFLEIRERLKDYNETVIQMTKISQAESPTPHDLEFLRSWMERPNMGNFPLVGCDRNSYGLEHELDLMAVRRRPSPSLFSQWFTDTVIPKWHELLGRKVKSTTSDDIGCMIYNYRESTLASIVGVTTTVIASLLPVGSVVMLYFASTDSLRLGLIILVSATFALALALMTTARKIEVFAATSAFAAVNVVFLTNQMANGCSCQAQDLGP